MALCVLLPVPSEEGTEAVLLVGQDVTDWTRHERLLERQNRRLDEFTSVVSHDLRSPLAVASGHLELARADCDSDHLDYVERALVRMERLVVDLRTLARQGDDIGTLDSVDLSELVRRCWTNVETGDARLRLDGELTFRADRSRVGQLFENLFRNSVEHASTDGRLTTGDDAGEPLTVTVGPLPDGNGFFVEDDGPGIPPDEREAAFEAGHSTAEDGTGFGLRIVEAVGDAHGWDVSVVTGRAGGARFEITGVDGVNE
jgi:signal transduction histidine kinase